MTIIGYTAGVFDVFHIGHVNLLKRARAKCDYLIVAVTTDELCVMEKGKTPLAPCAERIEIVSSIKYVDKVVEQTNIDKVSAWSDYRFHKIFVGDDWRGTVRWQGYERQFKDLGVEVVYLPYTKHTSSTILAEAIRKLQ
jgi:glycerol-3-phosphate cytidylyltransferase